MITIFSQIGGHLRKALAEKPLFKVAGYYPIKRSIRYSKAYGTANISIEKEKM